jgi:hypothetical protein
VSQPRDKAFEAEVVGFVETADENIGVVAAGRHTGALMARKV